MAFGRWVLTARVTVPAGTASAADVRGVVAWSNGSGATSKWAPAVPVTFQPGMIIYADDTTPGATPTAAQQLYQAIIAVNASALRAYVTGTDAVGHAGLAN
jgi:hypothetical protein